MRQAACTLAALWLGLLGGCERSPAPAASQPAEPASDRSGLHDWVLRPAGAAEEQRVPCPRLLSAAPNVTEICCALGLADCLVGRTRYCTYPPAIEAVPSIGALNDLNVEALLQLRPEMIVVSGTSRAVSDRLSRLGLRFESVPDDSLADLFTAIERIGVLTGRTATARRLRDALQADLDTVARRFAGGPTARVLILTGPLPDPPMQVDAAGPGSFYEDLLRCAGHRNVAESAGRPWTPLSLEFVLRADPDVIVELAPDRSVRPAGDNDARRVWAKVGPLRAVQQQRVHVLVGPQYFVLGPRIAYTFEALCETIRGEHHE